MRRHPGLREDIRRWGIVRVIYAHLMDWLHPLLYISFVYVRQLGNVTQSSIDGFDIRVATREELQMAGENHAMDLGAQFLQGAFDRGDICVAAFAGESMVAYSWRAFSGAPHDRDLWVRFEKPCRYGYKGFTLPEYRGKHIQAATAPCIDHYCIERGYTQGISFIETHNFASNRTSQRLGSRRVGYAGYLRLFGRVIRLLSTGTVLLCWAQPEDVYQQSPCHRQHRQHGERNESAERGDGYGWNSHVEYRHGRAALS